MIIKQKQKNSLSSIKKNFEDEFVQKSSHYFQYGFDRLFYSELVKKKE